MSDRDEAASLGVHAPCWNASRAAAAPLGLALPLCTGTSFTAYQEMLPYRRNQWMVVEPNQVSLDGTECNKIGTSYA